MSGGHLLLVSLGPVQDFIAQARRSRDLWFGSHLLSELSRAAAKSLAEDKKNIAATDKQESKDGKTAFNDGYNYVLLGQSDKGLAMMQQGLKMGGGFQRVDHAKLQLGYAYHLAGQKDKAVQTFKSVQGTDGAAALARLWVIRLNRSS